MTGAAKGPTRADVGRERATVRIAWLPRRLTDGRWVWLERVVVVERVAKEFPPYWLHPALLPAHIADRYWYPVWRRVRVVHFTEFLP